AFLRDVGYYYPDFEIFGVARADASSADAPPADAAARDAQAPAQP
ncbi:DUF2827 domain-containing protein, partial [Burkholderia multivorans]